MRYCIVFVFLMVLSSSMNTISKFFLVLNGPPTAGKTSVARELFQNNERIFLASRDSLKRMISHYRNDDPYTIALSYHITLDLAEDALTRGLSVIIDQGFFSQNGGEKLGRELLERASSIAKDHQVKLFLINVEAPDDILLERFRSRVRKANEEKTPVSLTDEEEFKRRISFYKKYKHYADATFRSDVLSPRGIADEIVALVRKNDIDVKN